MRLAAEYQLMPEQLTFNTALMLDSKPPCYADRDLYQQKLAYVRGYLESVDRLVEYDQKALGFLSPVR